MPKQFGKMEIVKIMIERGIVFPGEIDEQIATVATVLQGQAISAAYIGRLRRGMRRGDWEDLERRYDDAARRYGSRLAAVRQSYRVRPFAAFHVQFLAAQPPYVKTGA